MDAMLLTWVWVFAKGPPRQSKLPRSVTNLSDGVLLRRRPREPASTVSASQQPVVTSAECRNKARTGLPARPRLPLRPHPPG
eukprot:507553-Heterocapsa_arctica.AAC.1